MRSIVNAWIAYTRDDRKETMSSQVMTVVCMHSEELNLEDMESEVDHREVPTKETAVKFSGTMKKQHRGQHLAAGQCGEPKQLTRGDCGSWRKLAATCRKVSRHAAVAQCKGNIFRKIWTQVNYGPRSELATDGKEMTRCAKVEQRKGHGLRGQS
jgi:hypothetical protein